MEQEEAELKKTYARALKDRDAIWSRIKLHLSEKRKNEAATMGLECINEFLDRQEKTGGKGCTDSAISGSLDELSRVKSSAFEWCNSYDPKGLFDAESTTGKCTEEEEDDDDDESAGSMEFVGVFEVDDIISPTVGPAAEEEDASIGNISCSSEGDDFWEQEPDPSFAGFSSVEKQGLRVPKPGSSLPIFIQRKDNDRPSQAGGSPRATGAEDVNFCHGLVVDSQYKSVPFSDKASSFSVPKKRMTFL